MRVGDGAPQLGAETSDNGINTPPTPAKRRRVTWTEGSSADGVSMRESVERECELPHVILDPWLDAATGCTSIGASVATHDRITFCICAVQAALHRLALLEENTGLQSPGHATPGTECIPSARSLLYCPAIRCPASAFTQRRVSRLLPAVPSETSQQGSSQAAPLQDLLSASTSATLVHVSATTLTAPIRGRIRTKPRRASPHIHVQHGILFCCGRTAVSPAQADAERQEHIWHKLWLGGQQCV
jgi:hypothetical protein